MTKTLFYAGEPGDGYGWGVCNRNLIRELSKLCTVWAPDRLPRTPLDTIPVFMPIADHDLTPSSPVRGNPTIGYCFFEYDLGPKAVENSKLYDLIFCGSTWCKERLAERGIMHTEVLIQGVDHEIFKPIEKAGCGDPDCCAGDPDLCHRQEFRIFSGGKFEYRKGQDIVLAAFKLLQDKYPQMRLVTAWANPWPELFLGMSQSPHISLAFEWHKSQSMWLQECLRYNGVRLERVEGYGQLSQHELADIMRSTDLGVFPNRCEGGTNLVLMEYLACGKPAIASYGTGHLDILGYYPCPGKQGERNWTEVDPETLAGDIEVFYRDNITRKLGDENALNGVQQWTWERAARQILAAVERFQKYGTAVKDPKYSDPAYQDYLSMQEG